MKKYILSILLSGAFMFTACSDFLDEVPKGNITSEGYYKTAQHAISATNAIYDYLIIGYAPNGLWDKTMVVLSTMIIGFFRICLLIIRKLIRPALTTNRWKICK